MKCTVCNENSKKTYPYGKDRVPVCEECMGEKVKETNTCPVCGYKATPEDKEVAIILTAPNATPGEKAKAPEALTIVCPKCHVLFFDDLDYNLLQARIAKQKR